jgi:putative ABC transport system permease protein
MAMREQSVDIGIMKALGFTDGAMFGTLLAQALLLCGLGGSLGMLLAWSTQKTIADGLAAMFPGFVIKGSTFAIAACVTVLLGLLAGLLPAWNAKRLRPVQALRGD